MKIILVIVLVFTGAYLFSQYTPTEIAEYNETTIEPVDHVSDSGIADILNEAREVTGTGERVEIYDGILVAQSATTIDLSGRGLSGSLKAEIRQVSDLVVLDLSDNAFTGLPAEVGQLRELQELYLANNPITGLPMELGNLQKLQVLDLRGTAYAQTDLDMIRSQLPITTSILTD